MSADHAGRTPLTRPELQALAAHPEVDVDTAASAYGLGRNAAYNAIHRGDFPCATIKVGRLIRVPTAGLLASLGVTPDDE